MAIAKNNPAPSTLPDLISQITSKFNPKKVILFGSWARGDARPNSDIDLAFVLDGREYTDWDTFYCFFLEEAETLHKLDMVRTDQVSAELNAHIDTYGVVIYER